MSPFDNFNKASLPSAVSLTLTCQLIIMYQKLVYSPFFLHDLVDLPRDFFLWQGRKPKPRTTGLNSGGDLVDVITQDAESDVLRMLLDHSSSARSNSSSTRELTSAQSGLGLICHHIRLVQNHQLEAFPDM
jgi:hypothetical protein